MKRLIPILFIPFLFSCQREDRLEPSSYYQVNEVDGQFISSVYVPTSFTPNGDGINDQFGASMTGIQECSFRIHSKSQLIYESHEISPSWSGLIGNSISQTGTYQWTLIASDTVDYQYNMQGEVSVFR